MKDTRNQTNDTTNKQSSKRNNYLLGKGARRWIFSSLLLMVLIHLMVYVGMGSPSIDTHM